jgi:hypothetical protein
VLVAAWSEGSLDRLLQVLDEHGLEKIETVDRLSMVKALSRDKITAGGSLPLRAALMRAIWSSLPSRIFSVIALCAAPSAANAIRISFLK